ncbi:MAG: glycosyltransferase family 39 protein [Chloroflexi bacterium]|nr:glycosyltransferase family 39 protein [Chloroflexota bacterium]
MTFPTPKSEIRNPKSALWLMTAVLLAAAALRFIGIVHISPPGLAHDEVANWLIDRLILSGEHAIYFTRAYGHEAGYHYWQALLVALIGDHALSLRLASGYVGLLGVAVTYALARKLFGVRVALTAAGITAVLFLPVFYGRLGLRAISLPLVAGLSAYFWWQAWDCRRKSAKGQRPLVLFALSGFFGGLSLYTYLAARAVPIFYALFVVYLAIFHRAELKARWRGVVVFGVVFAIVAAPLVWFLQNNPGAEFRVAEVAAPLNALRAGDFGPVLQNGVKILGMFGFTGVPIWREGIPGQPLFEPLLAICFYGGVLLSLWRWRDMRYAFLLLWAGTAVLPSIATINAPSSIRIVNILPVLGLFPALFIHNSPKLSTVYPRLSTGTARFRPVLLTFLFVFYAGWTAWSIFEIWPNGGDIPFVWQAALHDTAVALDHDPAITAAAIGGWSPDTMDKQTMALYVRRDDLALSHFGAQAGEDIIYTVVIPAAAADGRAHIFHPTALPLAPFWQEKLLAWGATSETAVAFTHITLPAALPEAPQFVVDETFGGQLQLFGYSLEPESCLGSPRACQLVTYWRVVGPITQPMRVFVQVLDANGDLVAEDYRWDAAEPQALWQPHWQPGDTIIQLHPVSLANASQLRLGLFDPYSCDPGPCQNVPTAVGAPFVLLPMPAGP